MSVVEFPRPARNSCRTWHHEEVQRLVALYSAHAASGEVAGWEIGATESEDPQFYLLGPEHDCVLCVSRVGRIYVLEDGAGALITDDARLEPVIDKAAQALAMPKVSFGMRVLLSLCAIRVTIEQKLEPFLAESTETLTRFAPQLAAFV
jgi:hypothetical protein